MAEAPPTKKRKEEKDDSDEGEGTDDPIPSSMEPLTTAKKVLSQQQMHYLVLYTDSVSQERSVSSFCHTVGKAIWVCKG